MVRIRTKPSKTLVMPGENFFRTLRSLAECYQAFETYSGSHVRSLGLTPAQFDILATLGNTPGMTCRQLGAKTLITKGTLTGVLDRMAARGLVRRGPSDADRRQVFVSLTAAGARLFVRIFPLHAAHVKKAFTVLSSEELDQARALLQRLRDALRDAHQTMKVA
jgi:MarR family 2-MHQ and catechol resistance regulon transcriptional repressor